MNAVYDVITRLREMDGSFNAREQRVATFVLANLDRVAQMSIAELAGASDVSEPTVIRFCRTLGCDGFRDFKMRLAQNVAVSLEYLTQTNIDVSSEPSEVLDYVLGSLYTTANIARSQLDFAAFARAVDALKEASQILCVGLGGGSSTVAFDAANRFFRLGIPSTYSHDGYLQQMRAAALTKGDVVLAISASGEARDIVLSVQTARQYGATTIAITRPKSQLAEAAEIGLLVDLPEDPHRFKPTASRLVHLLVIDALATAVAVARWPETIEKLRRIRATLTARHGRTGPQPIGD